MTTLGTASASVGCPRCAQLGKTCCQRCDVLVTIGDRRRMETHGVTGEFWERRASTSPDYLDQPDDPSWLRWVFRPDGTRPVLKRRPNGDCSFLSARGCTLAMEVRPLVCRLYPYEYTERGLTGVSTDCPSEVIRPGSTILKTLDVRREDAIRWHQMLYSELRTGAAYDEDRSDLRPAG